MPSPPQGQSCPARIFIWFWSHWMIGSIQSYTQSQHTSAQFAQYAWFKLSLQVNTCQSCLGFGNDIFNHQLPSRNHNQSHQLMVTVQWLVITCVVLQSVKLKSRNHNIHDKLIMLVHIVSNGHDSQHKISENIDSFTRVWLTDNEHVFGSHTIDGWVKSKNDAIYSQSMQERTASHHTQTGICIIVHLHQSRTGITLLSVGHGCSNKSHKLVGIFIY